MIMAFLLDTNIVSDLVRNPRGRIAARIAEVDEENVCTSIIVAAELRYGAAKAGSARLEAQLAAVLGALDVLAFEPPADVAYGALRAELEKRGRPVGANDMLIAAQALALGHTLVTDNAREFSQVSQLTVMNWLR
ncbi:MAG TPA: type II toxin-antitoxin system VapC family toxin [Xanthobacteraceae bacterium]|nr:type II toxin-antitoxin system VapC family toxin [Xanthobacteraceae bacterium]